MSFLDARRRATLDRLCHTLVPADPDAPGGLSAGADTTDLVHWLEIGFARVMERGQRSQFAIFLSLIETAAFNRLTAGIGKPLAAMTDEQRAHVLRCWAVSPLPLIRGTFQSIKRLALFLHYTLPGDAPSNPAYAALRYAPPTPPPPTDPPPIRPLVITGDTTLTCDALIIGSGAGGGLIAARLTAAGLDVIVVEKGAYFRDADFHGRELASTETLFEKYGALTTADLHLTILAGSTLGGGTTVNWAASLRTPDDVRHEWAQHGFTGADGAGFTASLDRVCARLAVTIPTADNAQNCALHDGCTALGYDLDFIPRNAPDCADAAGQPRCGFCNYGCAHGSKRGGLKTYLLDAHRRGARILVQATADRIVIERGRALGAQLTVRHGDAEAAVTVRAGRVIVCAGALHTPALLLRSGIDGAQVGRNLHLHPATVTYGMFDQPILGWQGAPMTRISRQFVNLDGAGYGVRLETAPIHPGIAALSIPWGSARQHRSVMATLPHLANVLVLTRDRFGGRVRVDRRGQPVIAYTLHPHDAAHVRRGILEGLKVHRAAGAHTQSTPHTPELIYKTQPDADGRGRWPSFEAFLAAAEAAPLIPHRYALFSAHQMSSCRVGSSPATGVVDPTGRVYGVEGLYVADGSILPTASGVNPMISILAAVDFASSGWV